jgi:hypothetical protein
VLKAWEQDSRRQRLTGIGATLVLHLFLLAILSWQGSTRFAAADHQNLAEIFSIGLLKEPAPSKQDTERQAKDQLPGEILAQTSDFAELQPVVFEITNIPTQLEKQEGHPATPMSTNETDMTKEGGGAPTAIPIPNWFERWLNQLPPLPLQSHCHAGEPAMRLELRLNRSNKIVSHRFVQTSGCAVLDDFIEAHLGSLEPLITTDFTDSSQETVTLILPQVIFLLKGDILSK